MLRTTRAVAAVAACALSVTLVGCGDDSTDVVIANSSDSYPNRTASDWVTYADHVVVATAVSDRAMPPDAATEETGEGGIDRKVTLSVDNVIWSRGDASHRAPEGPFEWDAWGWALQDGRRIPMASDDQPRVEVGHTYIMAIVWQPTFNDGHDHVPAQWTGLGSDAILPYDDGVIGKGELAGQEQRSATPLAASDPNFSLEDELAGEDAAALAAALRSAKPGPRLDYGPATEEQE